MTNNFGFVPEENIDFGFVPEQPKKQTKTLRPLPSIQETNQTEYQRVLSNPALSKQQKVDEIKKIGEAEIKAIDEEKEKNLNRIRLGATIQGLSGAPMFKTPFVGSAVGGAMFDAGGAIMEGAKGQEIADRAKRGALAGATVEGAIKAIPIVGKPLAKSKAGKAIINKSNEIVKPLLNNQVAKNIGETLSKDVNLPFSGAKVKPLPSVQEVAKEEVKSLNKANLLNEQNKDFGFISDDVPLSNDVKKRSLEQSILEAKGTPKEVKEIIKKDVPTYNILHNKDVIEQATKEVESNFANEYSRLATAKDFDALDFEKSRQIAKRLFDNGEYEQAINLIDNVSANATKKGQAIQALSLWSNMTPEGAVFKAEKLIKEFNKTAPKNKQIKLTPEQIKTIREMQTEALNTTDELSKNQAFARTAKYIGELVPKNFAQQAKAYRNIALLLNPKTLGRNIVGNALFNAIDTGSKALAVPIDRMIGKFTGQQTRVLPQGQAYLKGLKQGAKTGFEEALQGIDTRGLGQRFDLQSGRTFKNKPMQALETALDVGLRTPDRAFYEATFAESVENMMRAKGLTEPTQEILEQAEREALESVFQNQSKLSDMALRTRKALNTIGTKDFGLGDVLIPYAQTPANLAQQGINYSPLGFIKGASNLAQGNQREASLDIARSLIGSGLIGGGYGLSKAGVMTPSQFDENYQKNKRIRENLQPLGIRPDQIGDIWYSPFQPMSIPLAVGNAMAYGENPIKAGTNTIVDLPFLQGISKGLRDLQEGDYQKAVENVVSSVPAQFTPTIGSQIAQSIDNYQRETYSPNKLEYGLNQAIAKIPFASQTLPIRYDVTGQPIQRYDSEGLQRGFDVFLNPTFVNQKKDDFVLSELKNLYDKTGETKQLLPSVDKKLNYVDVNGQKQKLELTGKQASEYQRVLGQLNYQTINDLMQSPDYQRLSDDEKVKEINLRIAENNKIVKNRLFQIPLPSQKKQNPLQAKRNRVLSKKRKLQTQMYQNSLDEILNELYSQE